MFNPCLAYSSAQNVSISDDGLPHIFVHPSGDTMKAIVKDFNVDEAAERYTKRG
jgi:hypothetical protein